MAKFIDLNYPGVIYEGEQGHFDYVLVQGGCPQWVNDAQALRLMQAPLSADDPTPWRWQSAPTWWAYAAAPLDDSAIVDCDLVRQ